MLDVLRGAVVAGVLALLAVACDPVVPLEEPQTTEFEGFAVHSFVPDDPVGIVFVFHGSGGSADIALKVEPTDQLNELVERGYGWVATSSTERTGDRRWEVRDPSLVTNPDLARLVRLHDDLVATTGVDADTPIYGIGMSNGARMVTLFGQTFADAGYPVAAVAPFMGRAATPVQAAGGLTVPGFWVVAVNDTTVPPEGVIADHDASAARGTPTQLSAKHEEPLSSARFTRIPALDGDDAEEIRSTLAGTGVWDADGQRVVPLEDALVELGEVRLPQFGSSQQAIRNQVQALLAGHQFIGLFKVSLADFFDLHRP